MILDNASIAAILHEDMLLKLSDKIVELISADPDIVYDGVNYDIEGFRFTNEELVLESHCLCAFLITFTFQRRFKRLAPEKTGPVLDLFHGLVLKDTEKITKEKQDMFPDILRERFRSYYPAVSDDDEGMQQAGALASYRLVDAFLGNLLSGLVDAEKDLIGLRFHLGSDISGLHRLLLDTYDKILV